MNLLDYFLTKKHGKDSDFFYKLVLDIGTENLKATIIEFNGLERHILGFGSVKQDYGNMKGGAITDIQGVVKKVREVIAIVSAFTPHKPVGMVCGIAGEFVKGIAISVNQERINPHKKIDRKEIQDLIGQAQEKAYQQAVKRVEMETGVKDVKLELINSSIVEVRVDGYKVNNPYQFQGTNINNIVYSSYAPLVQIGALRTISQKLGFKLDAIVAEPFAIANSMMTNEAYEFGAIIIDIGGGTTDIALIRNGGIEGTRMFAMGGRAFTRTLASNLKINLAEAEKVKLTYSGDKLLENYKGVDKLIKADLQILYQGIELSLQELAQGEVLPRNIYFCGGGSALKGLIEGFKACKLTENLFFSKEPNVQVLQGVDIVGIKDETNLLAGVEYTTPRSLSLYGTTIANEERRLLNFGSQGL